MCIRDRSKTFAVNHGYWMSLTLVFILQPYVATTWQRTVERVIGSVAGAIGASLLGLLMSTPLSVALAVLPIALGTFAARTCLLYTSRSFGFSCACCFCGCCCWPGCWPG